MTFERSLPGFTYAIGSPPGMACIVCHATGRAFLFRKGEDQAGICEACSGLARWAWRQVEGESVPGGPEDPVISRVYVLVCRRKRIPRADAPHGTPEDKRMMLAPADEPAIKPPRAMLIKWAPGFIIASSRAPIMWCASGL